MAEFNVGVTCINCSRVITSSFEGASFLEKEGKPVILLESFADENFHCQHCGTQHITASSEEEMFFEVINPHQEEE